MCKSSFTVGYRDHNRKKNVVILGVTAIFPNLNGVLFQTEDNVGVQVEYYELGTDKILGNMYISYEEWISETTVPSCQEVLDHRAK